MVLWKLVDLFGLPAASVLRPLSLQPIIQGRGGLRSGSKSTSEEAQSCTVQERRHLSSTVSPASTIPTPNHPLDIHETLGTRAPAREKGFGFELPKPASTSSPSYPQHPPSPSRDSYSGSSSTHMPPHIPQSPIFSFAAHSLSSAGEKKRKFFTLTVTWNEKKNTCK